MKRLTLDRLRNPQALDNQLRVYSLAFCGGPDDYGRETSFSWMRCCMLARPVWLLNRFESEWRWFLEREDSPWYPTMRIFRQPVLHDWGSVIERLAEELRRLAARQAEN